MGTKEWKVKIKGKQRYTEQIGPVTSLQYLQLESQESRNNRSEAIFKERMIENLPKLKQTVKPQIYESLYIHAEKIIKGGGENKEKIAKTKNQNPKISQRHKPGMVENASSPNWRLRHKVYLSPGAWRPTWVRW